MKSSRPKVLHALAGVPLVGHVLATAARARCRTRRRRRAARARRGRRGRSSSSCRTRSSSTRTRCRAPAAPSSSRSSALPADSTARWSWSVATCRCSMPTTLARLIASHSARATPLTLLSAILDDPTGYGRIVRSARRRIRLDRRAEGCHGRRTADHRDQRRRLRLRGLGRCARPLGAIGTDNAQGEKYLTDVAAGIRASGGRIEAVPVADPWLVAGINDRVQLSAAGAAS